MCMLISFYLLSCLFLNYFLAIAPQSLGSACDSYGVLTFYRVHITQNYYFSYFYSLYVGEILVTFVTEFKFFLKVGLRPLFTNKMHKWSLEGVLFGNLKIEFLNLIRKLQISHWRMHQCHSLVSVYIWLCCNF